MKTEKTLIEDYANILFLKMTPFETYTRQELCCILGTNDRTMRRAMTLLKAKAPVISLSCRKGYMLLGEAITVKNEDRNYYKEMVERQIAEYGSRVKMLLKNSQKLIKYLEELGD